MGTQHQSGFTIIEVTLFLAISGLLAILLLGGWNVMINTQRYKDSIRTTQAFIQQQYNLVYNVENGRSKDITGESCAGVPRGQSDCILLGRYIRITNGTDFHAFAIVGKDADFDGTVTNDTQAILASNPKRINSDIGLTDNNLEIPWQAEITGEVVNEGPRNMVIAIIRSPLSGIVHTYSQKVTDAGVMPLINSALLASGNESRDQVMCLDSGSPLTGGQLGITIKKYASSQSFVQTIEDGTGVCA